MSRVAIAYAVSGLSLFGALFAAFALSGVGLPDPIAPVLEPEAVEAQPKPAEPPPGAFVPPRLDPGRPYRISHATPIYGEPSTESAVQKTIPAGGTFTFVGKLDTPPGPWFEISIVNDRRERLMYLLGADLRWKSVTPIYSPDEAKAAEIAKVLELIKQNGGLLGASRRQEAPPPPAPPEPQEFAQWWAATAERLGGPVQANLIASGVAAGLTTLLTVGAIAVLSMFRRQTTWTRPAIYTHDDAAFGEDDPYPVLPEYDASEDDETGRRRV